jgi:zinc and cadmium transporter
MSPPLVLAAFAALTLVGSLLGGWIPGRVRLTHARLQVLMSLVAGLMLGVGLFHMLPHAAEALGSVEAAVLWLAAGLLATFFLQRFLHFHHHEAPEMADAATGVDVRHAGGHGGHDHSQCDHAHPYAHPAAAAPRALSWAGIAAGLVLHTLLDGMALAASVDAEAAVNPQARLPGVETFLAVALHKPLDSMAIATLMLAAGATAGLRRLVNLGFALVCPLGAASFYFGAPQVFGEGSAVAGAALAFSGGMFVCISLADLLPEVQFHRHDRIKLSLALVAGVALAFVISRYGHQHHEHDGPGVAPHDHDHGHDHGAE